MKVVCYKTIPHLCKAGEVGEIKLTPRTIIETGRTSFYCSDPWHRVKKVADLIEFSFEKSFDNEDVKRMFGKDIELKDFFKKSE